MIVHTKKFRDRENSCVQVKKSLVDSKYEQKHTLTRRTKMQNSKPSRRLPDQGEELLNHPLTTKGRHWKQYCAICDKPGYSRNPHIWYCREHCNDIKEN